MARPQKKGLDYFPLDVTMDKTNDDVELLEAKYKVNGFETLVKLYMKIYHEEGYFIKWCEKTGLLLSKRVDSDINEVNAIINDLLAWGVFDSLLYEKFGVLTSIRIQKTYTEAVKKRKEVEIIKSLLLLEKVNSNINLIDSDIYPQSKVKYIKVKQSKEEKTSKCDDGDFSKYIIELLENNIKILKPLEYQTVSEWLEKYDAKIIAKAINIATHNSAKSLKYIDAILLDWETKLLDTIEKLDEYLSKAIKSNQNKGKNVLPKDVESDWFDDYLKKL